MLQEKFAAGERFLNRDCFKCFLELAFAVEPSRQREQVRGFAVFELRAAARDELVVTGCIRALEQIEREKFLRRFGQRMIFERVSNFFARHRDQPSAGLRLCHRLAREQHQCVERGCAFAAGKFFNARPSVRGALVNCFRAARQRQLEKRRLQELRLTRARIVENFIKGSHRFVGQTFLDRELRG